MTLKVNIAEHPKELIGHWNSSTKAVESNFPSWTLAGDSAATPATELTHAKERWERFPLNDAAEGAPLSGLFAGRVIGLTFGLGYGGFRLTRFAKHFGPPLRTSYGD
jgi:hypothetical protein